MATPLHSTALEALAQHGGELLDWGRATELKLIDRSSIPSVVVVTPDLEFQIGEHHGDFFIVISRPGSVEGESPTLQVKNMRGLVAVPIREVADPRTMFRLLAVNLEEVLEAGRSEEKWRDYCAQFPRKG